MKKWLILRVNSQKNKLDEVDAFGTMSEAIGFCFGLPVLEQKFYLVISKKMFDRVNGQPSKIRRVETSKFLAYSIK